jgi:threonylcarbamoyladenosine tRNA methylthiotransferase MtaB
MRLRTKAYFIKTFGCRTNQAESLGIEKNLQAIGFLPVSKDGKPDLVVVNSCVVTKKAEKEVRQLVRSLRRRHPKSFLVVVGCGVNFWRLRREKLAGADLLLSNRQKGRLAKIVSKKLGSRFVDGEKQPVGFLSSFGSIRTLVRIQGGCDQFCSYCLVPHLRKRLYSKLPEEVVAEVNEWVSWGAKEVVLTGINLEKYEFNLTALLRKLLTKTKILRIRFGSINVGAISDELLDLYQKEHQEKDVKTRLCRHFHIPLQSGSGRILKKMGRKYTPSEYAQLGAKIKRMIPGASITTDLIVGFPGETEKDFLASVRMIKKVGFLKVHVFRFSPRFGTLSWRMIEGGRWQGVDPRVVRARAKEARRVAGVVRKRELARLGEEKLVVLFDGKKKRVYEGYSDNFIRFKKKSGKDLLGKMELTSGLPAQHLLAPKYYVFASQGRVCGAGEDYFVFESYFLE